MDPAARERFQQNIDKSQPVGRVGETQDIAQAYQFLMKEASATGQIVVAGGGTALA